MSVKIDSTMEEEDWSSRQYYSISLSPERDASILQSMSLIGQEKEFPPFYLYRMYSVLVILPRLNCTGGTWSNRMYVAPARFSLLATCVVF
jgi:hypothetical protein